MSRLGQEPVQGECTRSLVLVVQVVRGECMSQRERVLVVLAEGSHSRVPTAQKHRPRRRPQKQRQRLGISIETKDWVSLIPRRFEGMRCSAPTYHDDLLTNRRVVLQSPAPTTLFISTVRRKLSVDFELDPTRFIHTRRGQVLMFAQTVS